MPGSSETGPATASAVGVEMIVPSSLRYIATMSGASAEKSDAYATAIRLPGAHAAAGAVSALVALGARLTRMGSLRQVASHPSPAVVFPSSHCSSGLSTESPQTPVPNTGWSSIATSRVSPSLIVSVAQPLAMIWLGMPVTASIPLPRTRIV